MIPANSIAISQRGREKSNICLSKSKENRILIVLMITFEISERYSSKILLFANPTNLVMLNANVPSDSPSLESLGELFE